MKTKYNVQNRKRRTIVCVIRLLKYFAFLLLSKYRLKEGKSRRKDFIEMRKSQVFHSMNEMLDLCICISSEQYDVGIIYLLQCDVFSPGLTVRMLSCDRAASGSAGPTSALWNIRSPSCARNVMFTEKPSAAPHPSFLSVCCACTKFSTPSSARVKKYRAWEQDLD